MKEHKNEEILELEKDLMKLYTKENDELQSELVDLLKETEEKAFELRERIAENKRFINSLKLEQIEKDEMDEMNKTIF